MSSVSIFLKSRNLYLLCFITIAVGLSLSKPLISIGEIGLGIIWLSTGNYKQKIIQLINNKTAMVLCSIYILTLVGLIYTSNFHYALGDVRRKLPLVLLPLVLNSFPAINQKEFNLIIKIFILGVIAASFWSLFVMMGGLNINISDKRFFSRFNSHIRFGLEICFAIYCAVYLTLKSTTQKERAFFIIATIYLLGFLFLLNSFTGIIIFSLTTILLLLLVIIKQHKPFLTIIFILLVFLLGCGIYFYFKNEVRQFYVTKNRTPLPLKVFTENGNRYSNDVLSIYKDLKENGYYVYRNIAWNEIEGAWNKKSKIPFEGYDLKGQKLKHTLLRFITSKGERKDAQSVQKLTPQEVNAIQKGIANYQYLDMNGFTVRTHAIIWEFDRYFYNEDINGHSVAMRWVFWQTAFEIIKQNFFLGVGTGDVQDAFNQQYEKDNSKLTPKYRLRAHNQYITYFVSFGIVGFIWFFIFLFFPIIYQKMVFNYLYLAFFSIFILSMLSEDTLETQVGITFSVFFNSILLLKKDK